jgi:uncharacterized protein YjiS (DUF1127 family)
MPPLSLLAPVRRSHSRFPAARAIAVLRRVPDWIARAYRVAAERRALGRMDARMFSDIGVGQAEAKLEAGRRFWDFD